MRYRDLIHSSVSVAREVSDNIALLHVRQGEMPNLQALIFEMDITLHGPIRRMPTGGAFVNVTCRDAATASALLASW